MRLYLAPMEGVGDRAFRRAIASIGGFDEACCAFISVPKNAHVKSLARVYDPDETAPAPQAAQIMGHDIELCAAMARELQERGAPRIDLNCGCPSNTVTGRGAGSSLLNEPDHLAKIATAMVAAVDVPVSVKIRSGYADTARFDEVCQAIDGSGASLLTLHPRTKFEGYGPPANWTLIARAKELVSIPVVGSGDVRISADAFRMVEETGCDGVMIGRGAIADPFIFRRIREEGFVPTWKALENYLMIFFLGLSQCKLRTQINKLKQLIRFMGLGGDLLRSKEKLPNEFFKLILDLIQKEGPHTMAVPGELHEIKSIDYSRRIEGRQDCPSPRTALCDQQERPQPEAAAERPCA